MLTKVAENVWEVCQPLRFVGAEVGCRMTCIRLTTGAVVVHSPVRGTPELFDAVEGLGPLKWLVAPNAFHHLFLSDWSERFPEATALVAPKLRRKRRDLQGATPLTEVPCEWGPELEVLPIEGFPLVNEFVFFHRPSATLVLTDLAFNFRRDSPFFTRWLIRLTGRLGELSPTIVERLLVSDRAAFRESIQRVLEWPFERVVVSHGEILESKAAREALARGYDWLLPGS